jgi:hypothetical protein
MDNKIQTNTNVKETLGISLPNILMSGITLSNAIDILPPKEDPHIDHPGEFKPAGLNEIKEANEATALDVSIKMILKETVNNDGTLSFITKGDFFKYMKVCVVQCLNEGISSRISRAPLEYLNPKNGKVFDSPRNLPGVTYQKLNFLGSIPGSGQTLLAALQNPIAPIGDFDGDYENIQAANLINSLPFSKEQDAEGNVVYNIPLEIKFTVSPKEGGANPKFLSYFAYAYFDVYMFIKDTKNLLGNAAQQVPIPQDIITRNLMGDVASDIVIVNHQPQQDTFIFRDGKGIYYCGEKHQMPDGRYMKGKIHLTGKNYQSSDYLTKEKIPNAKLADNRQTIAIGKVDFNYSQVGSYITNDDVVLSLAQNFGTKDLLKKNESIFSDLYSTGGIGGKHRFLFSINMHTLLAKNTVFPGLLATIRKTDKDEYNSILSQAIIREFKISRARVKKHQVVDSSFDRTTFSKYGNPLLIMQTSDDRMGTKLASKVQTTNMLGVEASDDLTPVGAIAEIFIKNGDASTRTFSVTDLEIAQHNRGLYQYTVSLTVDDPMSKYMQKKVAMLEKLLHGDRNVKGWELYVQHASNPEYSDNILNRFNVKFLNSFNKVFAKAPNFAPGAAEDVATSPSFVGDVVAKYVSTLFLLNAQEDAVSSATKALRMIQYLTTISSPNTGNPEGVQTVANLISDLITKLRAVLEQTTHYKKLQDISTSASSNAKSATPNIVSPSARKTFKTAHVFKELFEAKTTSLTSPYGYDFLSENPNSYAANIAGLRVVSSKSLKKRFLLETKKLFSSADANITISTTGADPIIYNPGDSIENKWYSFLAPSIAYVPRRPPLSILSKGSLAFENVGELSDLMLDVVRYNTDPAGGLSSADIQGQRDIDLPIIQQKRRMDLVEYFAAKGCSFEVPSIKTMVTPTPISSSPFRTAARFQRYGDAELSEFLANTQEIFLAEDELVNTPINPNKLLYTLTALDDLDFINKELPEQERRNSLSFYRITSPTGGKKFKDALFAYALLQALSQATGGANTNSQAPLTSAPNHVKSLILTAIKSPSAADSTLNFLISEKKKDGFKDPMMYAYLNFNYRILNRIQVFRGHVQADKTVQVNSANWSDLRKSDLDPNGFVNDEFLFCRQVRYYSDLDGTVPPKLLEMPVFDEYFLITPDDIEDFVNFADNIESVDSPASLKIFTQATNTGEITSGVDSLAIEGTSVSNRTDYTQAKIARYTESRARHYDRRHGAEREAVRTEMTNSNIVSQERHIEPIDRPDRKKAAQKLKAFEKITTQQQLEMLNSMKLGKLATLNNINSNVAQQRTNGQIRSGDEDLTPEEVNILNELASGTKMKEVTKNIRGVKPSTEGTSTPGGTTGGSTY